MLTVWCLAVAFFSPWVVGAPLTWLAHRCRTLRPTEWLWAPFVGLVAIICVLQNLVVFADLPIRQTTGWFWASVGLSWAGMFATQSGRKSFQWLPLRVIALSLTVYLLQGIGVVAQGVEWYRGNMLSDQFQYVAMAQFVMTEPFSTDWSNVGEHAWLVVPLSLKGERFGQSVVHAFFAVTAARDAIDLYFPTQLLAAGLLVPAGVLLARQCGLPRWLVQWTAVTMGLAPATAVLAARCYLSHALCVPALVVFLAAVIRLSRGGGWRALPAVMIAFQLGFAVYTEFAPLFFGTATVALATGWLCRYISVGRVLGVGGGLILAVFANPAALANLVVIAQRSSAAGPAMTLEYPTTVWMTTLWLHTGKALAVVFRPHLSGAQVFVFACFGMAACGAVWALGRAIRDGKHGIPIAACYSLLVPPVAVWLLRPESSYVLGKLVWTLTPIAVLSVAFALHGLTRTARFAARGVAGFLVLMLAIQSYFEQRAVMQDRVGNKPALIWRDPDLREICDELRRRPQSDVVIALDEERRPNVPATANAAICFGGRHHHIQIAAPQRIWHTDIERVPVPQLTNITAIPTGTLVVVLRGSSLLARTPADVLVSNGTYQLIRVSEPVDGSVTRLMLSETARR
jgi:hypothetical protein